VSGLRRPLHAHLVGSVPLPDAETVFRRLAGGLGRYLVRMPDGETGIRRSWIRFLQGALAAHPAIEVATDSPPFQFRQWDGRLVREIPRLRVVDRGALDPAAFVSGYADMAIASWRVFDELRRARVIPPGIRFQISLPSPIAPTYNNMLPSDRPAVIAALTAHFITEIDRIAKSIPTESLAIQWDVCQEVLALEGYYDPGPVPFETETLDTLVNLAAATPPESELGFHLCYGSPLDEHLVQPRDAGVMVGLINALAARSYRSIEFVHFPVPKSRSDDGYFEPFAGLVLDEGTERHLGLIHYRDAAGDRARLATASRHMRVDGVATECGMGRGDPARLPELIGAYAALAGGMP
jgi:hypothetical protein